MNFILKYFCALFLLLNIACSHKPKTHQEWTPVNAVDSQIILQHLLNIQPANSDALTIMHNRGNVYAKHRQAALAGNVDGMKVLFLYAATTPRHDGEYSEALLTDIMSLYKAQPTLFLETLRWFPQFIPGTCHYLSHFFSFEDAPKKERLPFLKQNREAFIKTLKNKSALCINEFSRDD